MGGEERIARAEKLERDLLRHAKVAAKATEEQSFWRVKEAEQRCEALCRHHDTEIRDLQKQVADQIEECLAQAMGSRRNLLESRRRADEHLEVKLQAQRDEATRIVDG